MQSGDHLAGRFRLGPHLERSRRGELFLARDEQTGASCEVEWLRGSGFEGEEMTRLVEREVAIGERLAAVPGVVRALAWGAGDDALSLWIAREVVDGAYPLDPSRGSIPRRAAAVLAAARAVARLEREGLVHRDLGPMALLRAPDGSVRIGAFGLARLEGLPEPAPGPTGLPLSSLPCAAPEVLETPWRADGRADVFSLGALLFRGLTASWPFPGPSLVQVVRQHDRVRAGDVPPPRPLALLDDIPEALDRACADALALDPGRRTRSAADLAEALAAWLAPQGPLEADDDDELAALERLAPAPFELPRPAGLTVTWRPPTGRAPRPAAVTAVASAPAVALPAPPPPLPALPPPPPLPVLPALPSAPEPAPEPVLEPLAPEAAGLAVVDGATLVARVDARRLDELVRTLRRVEPGSATALLLDLQEVEHLGGAQLEALTEVLTIAERRGLLAAMFGLRRSLRQFLAIMRLEAVLPRALEAQDAVSADVELRRLASSRST